MCRHWREYLQEDMQIPITVWICSLSQRKMWIRACLKVSDEYGETGKNIWSHLSLEEENTAGH